jgi:hypothetical protein
MTHSGCDEAETTPPSSPPITAFGGARTGPRKCGRGRLSLLFSGKGFAREDSMSRQDAHESVPDTDAGGRRFSVEFRIPGTELWLFTGSAAALAAKEQGALLGLYINGVRGTELFGNLDPAWEWVRVNPGSPPELTISLPRAGFADANPWYEVVAPDRRLIQALGGWGG